MAVEQEAKSTIEQRRAALIDLVEERIFFNPNTVVSHITKYPNKKEYSLSWSHTKLENITIQRLPNISTVSETVKIKRRFWNGQMMEIVDIEIGNNFIFKDNDIKNKLNLEGEQALEKAEERIEEFLPPKTE